MGALKHCRECNMEKIARGRSRETNIARGKAECYIISLLTAPSCYFFHITLAVSALTGLLYWFIRFLFRVSANRYQLMAVNGTSGEPIVSPSLIKWNPVFIEQFDLGIGEEWLPRVGVGTDETIDEPSEELAELTSDVTQWLSGLPDVWIVMMVTAHRLASLCN